jgi:sulfur-carrier protein
MAVKLVFLGRLADMAGGAERAVAAGPLDAILAGLEPGLAAAVQGPRIRLARNGALLADSAALVLADGDELAFLPPVSGG